VLQDTADFGQNDQTDSVFTDQPLDRTPFTARVWRVITEGLAPARKVGRIAMNVLLHGRLF